MTKTTFKAGALLAPVPVVMVAVQGTSEALSRPNIITIAWAGQINSDPPMVSISVRPGRFSYGQILESGTFSVNLVSVPLLSQTDLCGVKSGRDMDKFAACGFTPAYDEALPGTPYIPQCPMSLLCRVTQRLPLGSHDLFLAEIVQVVVDEGLIDSQGALQLSQAGLACYAHGEYFPLGDVLGFFGYSVASPEVLERRLPGKK